MAGEIEKHSVVIDGHKTSVSLEPAFWQGLREIAADRGCTVSELVAELDKARTGNLSSAIRLFVLEETRARGAAVQS